MSKERWNMGKEGYFMDGEEIGTGEVVWKIGVEELLMSNEEAIV